MREERVCGGRGGAGGLVYLVYQSWPGGKGSKHMVDAFVCVVLLMFALR